ncbi:trigger factor [Planctomycetota bacterium]
MDEKQQQTELKNKVSIEEAGPCRKKVTIEIPEQTITNAADKQYEDLRKEAIVPGFRKGRAPRRLLEKRFGKETAEQIKLQLLAQASDSALKENDLEVLREPDIDYEEIELPESGLLKFDFEVEVYPEFDLPNLEGISVKKPKLKVTKAQIDREIEQLRKWSGVWAPREEGNVEADDQVIADATLKFEDIEEEEKHDNIEIYVRHNGFVGAVPVENLDELLKGAKTGELKKTTVEVAKTYFREEYRGKKVDIQIKIKEIKWLKPAPLDENFLRRFEVADEEELSEKVSETLQSRLEQQAKTQMKEQVYEYMLENTDFDLPTELVANQAQTVLQRQYASLFSQGLNREKIEEHMEQLKAGSEQQAKEQLKKFFIMDKTAEQLGIEVTEEELNGYIAQLAIRRQQRPERLREQMASDGSLTQFKLQMREDKCIDKLLESAKITEVKSKKKSEKAAKKSDISKKKQKEKDKTSAKKKSGK